MTNKGKTSGTQSTKKQETTTTPTTTTTTVVASSTVTQPTVQVAGSTTKQKTTKRESPTPTVQTQVATPVTIPTETQTTETTTVTTTGGSQASSEDRFEEHILQVESAYQEVKSHLHLLHKSLQRLKCVHRAELKRARVKKTKRSDRHKPTGFARTRPIPEKVATFIGVEPGTELSGPEITKRVWSVLKARNLTFKDDNRVLRVDNEVSDLFFVPMSVNNSTESTDANGFNFGNLQFYIKQGLEGKKLERKQKTATATK